MIKCFCDRCGKEIKGIHLEVTLYKPILIAGDINDKWELCSQCEMELTSNFLNPMVKNIY